MAPRIDASRKIVIEDISPQLDCGRYAVKREVGDTLEVSADIFKEGHDAIAAAVLYRAEDSTHWHEARMHFVENDRWAGSVQLERNTRYYYTVAAWTDWFGSWREELRKKFDAGQDVASELLEGANIVRRSVDQAAGEDRQRLRQMLTSLEDEQGSQTERVKLGTAITQISARTPASTAMTAITLDHLSGGRVILGLGVSGPQVVEGWYGQDYAKPLARTREYVDIVRRIVARDEPVSYAGEHYAMPLQGGTGLGKPLKSIVRPLRTDIPIYLGAEGPKNVALAAEIGDGWLPMFFSPKADDFYRAALAEGFARPGARHTADDFEVACVVPVVPGDDVEACADLLRPNLALYIGGMGARDRNFHKDVFERLGYGAECEKIQDAYLDGRKADAAAAVPTAMVEDVYLVGPPDKIRDDLERWRETCVTSLLVAGPRDLLEQITEIVNG